MIMSETLKPIVKVVSASLLLLSAYSMMAKAEVKSGTAENNAYAVNLWNYMLAQKLIGPGRVGSFPFEGSRPHGSIQELISTEAEVDGHKARLVTMVSSAPKSFNFFMTEIAPASGLTELKSQ